MDGIGISRRASLRKADQAAASKTLNIIALPETITSRDGVSVSMHQSRVDAQSDKFDALRFLRLHPTAQAAFDEWRGNLEKSVGTGDLGPALESHLSKYRKPVPSPSPDQSSRGRWRGPYQGGQPASGVGRSGVFRGARPSRLRRRPQCRGAGSEGDSGTHSQGRTEGRIQRARDLPRRMVRSAVSDRETVLGALEMLEDAGWLAARIEKTPGRDRVLLPH